MADYYKVLGVRKDATPNELRSAFRKLVLQYHPDVNRSEGAERRFREILEAYEVLSEPQKRRQFDSSGPAKGEKQFDLSDFTHVDELDDLFAGEVLENLFGRRGPHGPVKGKDLRFDIELTLEEVLLGGSREVLAPRMVTCPDCRGTGATAAGRSRQCPICSGLGQVKNISARGSSKYVMVDSCTRCAGTGKIIEGECPGCAGRGRRTEPRPVKVLVPPGVSAGAVLRLPDEGAEGLRGGPRGDLYLVVRIRPHPVFRREGTDLHCKRSASFALLALGGRLRVPTLDGTAELEIPPGTQSHTTFRMARQGLPGPDGRGRGDLLVTVVLRTPEELTGRQKEILTGLERPDSGPRPARRRWWRV